MSLVQSLKVGTDLTTSTIRQRVSHRYKFRIYMKKAPNLLDLEMAPASRLMPWAHKHQMGITKFNQPARFEVEEFYNNDITDLINPKVETDFNKSGRVDARRPEFAIKKWVEANQDFQLWNEKHKGAEFIRKTPLTMMNHYKGYDSGLQGLMQPDMCTELQLVFQQRSGNFTKIHTGVRHENWLNRWKIAPIAGGSRKWARKLKWFNLFGLANIFGGAMLNLKPIYGLLSLPLGEPATLTAVLNMDPVLFCSLWAMTHLTGGIIYYFQYLNQIVKGIWWEPDTRCLCVELMNFFEIGNLENRRFHVTHKEPSVIKIPQKFLSENYKVEVKKGYIQFDLAHNDTGGLNGSLPFQILHPSDSGVRVEKIKHGKCLIFNSMPLVDDQVENLSFLPPFDILPDHLTQRVTNANPEMTPEVDLSENATNEFYEQDDFNFGKSRWEFERRTMNYTVG